MLARRIVSAVNRRLYVPPDLLYCTEFDGANVIESVSGVDTGVDWGVSVSPNGPETHFGIAGWRVSNSSDNPIVTISGPVYAVGIEILFTEIDPIDSSTEGNYGTSVSTGIFRLTNSSSIFGIAIGGATSYLDDELVNIGGQANTRTGFCSNTEQITQASAKTDLFFSWNGNNYDIYLNGVRREVIASIKGHVPLAADPTEVTFGAGGSDGITISGVGIWNSELSSSEAAAIASNYRPAIEQVLG